MTDQLTARVAAALGWSTSDVRSFSVLTLRELVRPVSLKLAHELTLASRQIHVDPRGWCTFGEQGRHVGCCGRI